MPPANYIFSRVSCTFIVAGGPLGERLERKLLVGKFGALENVAEIGGTNCSSAVVHFLELVGSVMVLLHVEF